MQVRPATQDDLPAILDIYNEAVVNTTASYDYEPRTLEQRQAWFEEHQAQGLPILVALGTSEQVVGWSSLSHYHGRKGYQFTVENSVYVAAAHQGAGVGKALLAPLIEEARELGLHVIIAAIDAENQASVALHARFGFVTVGHFKEVGFKFGRWLDVIYMQRTL
jgi:L-amino acid N-acyltransferase YncA